MLTAESSLERVRIEEVEWAKGYSSCREKTLGTFMIYLSILLFLYLHIHMHTPYVHPYVVMVIPLLLGFAISNWFS